MGKIKDLTGQRFGKLIAIEIVGRDKNGGCLWRCKCDCGGEVVALSGNLVKGRYKGCGCEKGKSTKENLTGQRFGMLTVEKEVEPYVTSGGFRYTQWMCKCDCGREKIAKTSYLKNGKTNSCGCKTGFKHIGKIDISGKRYGKLVAIEPTGESTSGGIVWKCQCDCGNVREAEVGYLNSGRIVDCGCGSLERHQNKEKMVDLTGKRFGSLVAIKRVESARMYGATKTRWLCKCDCGKEIVAITGALTSGKKKSCGCMTSELIKQSNLKHGKCYTPLYNVWRTMRERCCSPKCKEYHNYGGRGITVCKEWLHDFQAFYDWAIRNGYRKNLTIDRINNDGNYEPSNCAWRTEKEQQRNKRTNRLIEYKGETKTLVEWSEITGIDYNTLTYRVSSKNWTIEEAFETPIGARSKWGKEHYE